MKVERILKSQRGGGSKGHDGEKKKKGWKVESQELWQKRRACRKARQFLARPTPEDSSSRSNAKNGCFASIPLPPPSFPLPSPSHLVSLCLHPPPFSLTCWVISSDLPTTIKKRKTNSSHLPDRRDWNGNPPSWPRSARSRNSSSQPQPTRHYPTATDKKEKRQTERETHTHTTDWEERHNWGGEKGPFFPFPFGRKKEVTHKKRNDIQGI